MEDDHGNRGKCAQPCRLPYSLVQDDINSNSEKTIDKGYLISPRDLCSLQYLPSLINAGITCFKIEGRLKSPEYVATVTRIYRKYIDKIMAGCTNYQIDEKDMKDLMQVFNRGGFSSGHLGHNPNRHLIFKEKSNNMGIEIGTVENYNPNKGHIKLKLKDSVSIGDTISFEKEPSKYTISELMQNNSNFTTLDSGKKVTIGRMKGNISVGNKVYKLASKELATTARQSFENVENKKILINGVVSIKKGQPMCMQIICTNARHPSGNFHNIKINVKSSIIAEEAQNNPLTSERVEKQIRKTGNTPFEFENIKIELDDNCYIPSISSLNELRRTALEMLEAKVIEEKQKNIEINHSEFPCDTSLSIPTLPPKISLSLRNLYTHYDYTKLDSSKIDKIYLALKLFSDKDYSDIIKYLTDNYDVYIYLPIIIKPNYKNIVLNVLNDSIQKYRIRGFIVSNIADFEALEQYKKKYELIGNYSLNVFNVNTMKEYYKLGLNRVTFSRELSKDAINELTTQADKNKIDTELIVYGNLPIMAMSYCLLGKTNKCYPNCGLHCKDSKNYSLKDRLGLKFKIIPDNLQTVTLLCNSKTLSIQTNDINIKNVRVDMMDENIDEINHILNTVYNRDKLEGQNYTNGNLNREV